MGQSSWRTQARSASARTEAIDLLDAALGVLAVPAHVHKPHAQLGQGTGSDAGHAAHKITFLEGTARTRIHYRPRDSWPSTRQVCARSPAVLACTI